MVNIKGSVVSFDLEMHSHMRPGLCYPSVRSMDMLEQRTLHLNIVADLTQISTTNLDDSMRHIRDSVEKHVNALLGTGTPTAVIALQQAQDKLNKVTAERDELQSIIDGFQAAQGRLICSSTKERRAQRDKQGR